MARKDTMIEYMLKFKKETKGAFILTIPETGNDVMIPKSQCEIFVDDENEELEKGKIYTISIKEWIAEEKKIDEGGEKQPDVKVRVTLIDERESAIRVKNDKFDLWFPKSTVLNHDFPDEKEEFDLIVPEWLLKKKLEEAENDAPTGRRVKQKPLPSQEAQQENDPGPGDGDFVEDDIPF